MDTDRGFKTPDNFRCKIRNATDKTRCKWAEECKVYKKKHYYGMEE